MPKNTTTRGPRDKESHRATSGTLYQILLRFGTVLIVLALFLGIIWITTRIQILLYLAGLFVTAGILAAYVGLVVFRPVAIFGFVLGRLLAWAYISLRRIPRNKPAKRIVVLGGAYPALYPLYGDPDYDIDLLLLVRLLEAKGGEMSIWICKTKEDLIRALTVPGVEEVYLLGHGGDHFFQLGPSELFYYCELADVDLPRTLHLFLLHCGSMGGKTACDYVSDSVAECIRIGDNKITNLEIARWIIERIVECSEHKTLSRILYWAVFGFEMLFVLLGLYSMVFVLKGISLLF